MDSLIDAVQNWWTGFAWKESSIPDLSGKTILVTGATDGVGFVCARAFARKNAHVIVHGRNEEKTRRAVEDIRQAAAPGSRVEYMIADLTDWDDIRAFAAEYKRRGYPLHVLLNNAGIQAPRGQRGMKVKGNFEVTVATNHFGPFYLTLLLLDVLKASAPSRIVWVNSAGSQLVNPPFLGGTMRSPGIDWFFWPGMDWNDLKGEFYPDSDWWQYSRTKLMNLMTAKEQAKRLMGSGVEVFVAHPGLCSTDHFGKADTDAKWSSAWVEWFANKSPWAMAAEDGAKSLMFACTAPQLHGHSGAYIGSPELGLLFNHAMALQIKTPNAPLARDPIACKRLYDETLKILHKDVDPAVPVNPAAGQIFATGANTNTNTTAPATTNGGGFFGGAAGAGGGENGAVAAVRDAVPRGGADKVQRPYEKQLPTSGGIIGGARVADTA